MKKVQIGIIGADSFHTVALVNQYLLMNDVEVVFVDTTLRGNMKMSIERQQRFESMLHGKVMLKQIDLSNHQSVDIYLVLNIDSSTHLHTINELLIHNKPIFVDKPIFTDLASFDYVSGKVMSSSGLRFAGFLKDLKLSNPIIIKGPLSYVDEVEGYFWYGIHMVEMLQTLTKAPISINSVDISSTGEVVKGESGPYQFELHGSFEDINFSVWLDDKLFELESYDHLYLSLAKAILDVDNWQSIDNTKNVIATILSINERKKMLETT